MKKLTSIFVFSVFSVALSVIAAEYVEYSVSGIVKDANGKPVQGVQIRNLNDGHSQVVQTDNEGKFVFTYPYSVPILSAVKEKVGFAVFYDIKKDVPVEVTLQKGQPRTVKVIDNKGKPVSNCKIRVYNRFPCTDVITDKNGQAEMLTSSGLYNKMFNETFTVNGEKELTVELKIKP